MMLRDLLDGNERPVLIPHGERPKKTNPGLGYSAKTFAARHADLMDREVTLSGPLFGWGDWMGYIELDNCGAKPLVVWVQFRPTKAGDAR